jgi:hypothetical protein
MSLLATTFRSILTGLKAVIAQIAAKERPRTEFLVRVYSHIGRTLQRFEKLVANWRAGTLPKPGKPRPGRPSRPPAIPRLPTRRAWLTRELNHFAANGSAYQLELFLATEDCRKLLAEVPRAGRILRPLARSLGVQMPGDPPPPAPRPARAAKPPGNPWLRLPAVPVVVTAERRGPDFYPPEFSKLR